MASRTRISTRTQRAPDLEPGRIPPMRRPSLPIAPAARPAKRSLPLLDARATDAVWKPIYTVWEITLRCDLACRHCGSRAGKARQDELSTGEALDLVAQ